MLALCLCWDRHGEWLREQPDRAACHHRRMHMLCGFMQQSMRVFGFVPRAMQASEVICAQMPRARQTLQKAAVDDLRVVSTLATVQWLCVLRWARANAHLHELSLLGCLLLSHLAFVHFMLLLTVVY